MASNDMLLMFIQHCFTDRYNDTKLGPLKTHWQKGIPKEHTGDSNYSTQTNLK